MRQSVAKLARLALSLSHRPLALFFLRSTPGRQKEGRKKKGKKKHSMSSMSVDEPSRLASPRGPRQLLRERRVSMLLRPRDETKVRY